MIARAFVLVAALAFNLPAFAVPLFLLSEVSPTLYRVDTDSLGTPEVIGPVTFGNDVIELVTTSPDFVYAFDRDSNSLLTLSTTDASATVTPLDRDLVGAPRGFDLSPEGDLHGVFGGMQLGLINPFTGTTSIIANLTGAAFVEAIAFGSDGTLYASGSPTPATTQGTQLYTINRLTGVMSLVGSIGLEIDTLGFGADGFLYGARSGPGRQLLYRIDPATAARTTVGDTGVNSIVGITPVATVPEPGIVVLLGLGIAGLGMRRLRQQL